MNMERKPLAEVTNRAIEVLYRELGAADALRFINQFSNGHGDYTAERDSLIGPMTLDEILFQIKSRNQDGNAPPRDS
jgi:hypothetical protein